MEVFKLLGTIAISNSDANDAISETTGKAESAESKMTNAFKKIGAAIATYFAIEKIKDFGQKCIEMASDVEEMQNKFDVVFQGMTDEVESWAETYAAAIGRNSNTIKGYLADNQNMFVGMGMTRDAAAGLSENLVSLALDLASFNNLEEDEAVNAMSKALMGETESAKRLGAVLNDNTRAMAMEALGYEGKYDALSEAEKMEVNYQAILMQSTDAVGDCERSLSSYKGQTIQLNSAKEKLYETIGTMLLPIMTELIGGMTKMITVVQSAVEWFREHETVAAILAVGIGTITAAIAAYTIAQSAAAIATAVATAATTAFGAVMAFVTSPITLVILAIGALIAIGVLLYKNWDVIKAKCVEFVELVKEKFMVMKDKVVEIFTAIKDKIKEIWEGIWSTIKGIINNIIGGVENMVNSVIKGINKLLSGISKVANAVGSLLGLDPVNLQLNELSLPRLATGGVLEKGQVGLLEGSGAEAVVPLERNREWIARVSEEMNVQGIGGNKETLNVLNGILAAMNELKDSNEELPEKLKDSIANLKFSISNREFARLVKAV